MPLYLSVCTRVSVCVCVCVGEVSHQVCVWVWVAGRGYFMIRNWLAIMMGAAGIIDMHIPWGGSERAVLLVR